MTHLHNCRYCPTAGAKSESYFIESANFLISVPTKHALQHRQLNACINQRKGRCLLRSQDVQQLTSWSGYNDNKLCMHAWNEMNMDDIQIKQGPVKQKCACLASMSSLLPKFSYLKHRVVACYVGVVVPGGRLGEEKHLLRNAVVVIEELLCICQRVCIHWWLPFISQRLRECQQLQQHEDRPQKPVHSSPPGQLSHEERRNLGEVRPYPAAIVSSTYLSLPILTRLPVW